MAATQPVRFSWEDPFLPGDQPSESERQIQDAAAAYCRDRLLPREQQSFRHEQTDAAIFREMASWACWARRLPSPTAMQA